MKTFESYSVPLIANIETRGGQLIVMSLDNREIMRKTLLGGETLMGFSSDVIVIARQGYISSYTAEFKMIATMNIYDGDYMRGVIGPNILVYRSRGNYLATYDKNFREITRRYAR